MNIVVLAGGISTERDVSLTSGENVLMALRSKGYNAKLLDLFLGYDGNYKDFFQRDTSLDEEYLIGDTAPSIEEVKKKRTKNSDVLFGPNVLNICREADIVFIALHGQDGENGKVQATFDLYGVKYTGSGYLGSAIAMNKYITKQLLVANEINTSKYVYIRKDDSIPEYKEPVVIKPVSGGSSVGVSIVFNESDYNKAIELAFSYENELIIEKYIKGREFSVGVLGDTVLPPIEIIPKTGFYDYKNKYQPGLTEEICPARLTEEETKELQSITKKAYDVLKLDIYGRIDFILNEEDHKFYALEANSLPGMTGTSLLPQEAKAIGIDFTELCEKIIELSQIR